MIFIINYVNFYLHAYMPNMPNKVTGGLVKNLHKIRKYMYYKTILANMSDEVYKYFEVIPNEFTILQIF